MGNSAPPLSLRLDKDEVRPYFLWDTTLTVRDLRRLLREGDRATWLYWTSRILRDARYADVWRFVSLREVLDHWDELRQRLGRERERWDFLIDGWRSDGLILKRGDEQCEVDVVRDTTPRVAPVEVKGRVRIDSLREIAANKVAALLSRSEVRNLVDLRHLVLAGVDLDQALEDAAMKDAGLSPDTLAMSLSWIPVEESRVLIADEDAETLRQFRDELIRRFRAQAFPGLGPEQ